MTPPLNPRIYYQDSKSALKVALQLEKGKRLLFEKINQQVNATYYALESFYKLMYTLKKFGKVGEKNCEKQALLTSTIVFLVEPLEGNPVSIAAQCLWNPDITAALCWTIHLKVKKYPLICSIAKHKGDIDWKALSFKQLTDYMATGIW